MVRNLCARVYDESSVLELREADVGLERSMLYLAGLICRLNYCVSFRKRLVHIADAAVVGSSYVVKHIAVQRELIDYLALSLVSRKLCIVLVKVIRSSGVVLHPSVVHQRSALSHCLFDRKYGLQRLVLHLDEVTCLYRFFERLSHYSGHTVAHVSYLLVKQSSVVRRRLRLTLSG